MKPQPAMGIPVGQRDAPAMYAPPPAYAPHNHQAPVGQFSTGLCDCFSDTSLCCLTCWCPCITFGRIAEIVDKGSSLKCSKLYRQEKFVWAYYWVCAMLDACGVSGSLYSLLLFFTGCQWIYSCTYRSKLKTQYGMQEDCCGDCCIHFCCEPCALCQEYRELQHHGFNVALGWHGNMERANQEMMPPSMAGGMTR